MGSLMSRLRAGAQRLANRAARISVGGRGGAIRAWAARQVRRAGRAAGGRGG